MTEQRYRAGLVIGDGLAGTSNVRRDCNRALSGHVLARDHTRYTIQTAAARKSAKKGIDTMMTARSGQIPVPRASVDRVMTQSLLRCQIELRLVSRRSAHFCPPSGPGG